MRSTQKNSQDDTNRAYDATAEVIMGGGKGVGTDKFPIKKTNEQIIFKNPTKQHTPISLRVKQRLVDFARRDRVQEAYKGVQFIIVYSVLGLFVLVLFGHDIGLMLIPKALGVGCGYYFLLDFLDYCKQMAKDLRLKE